MYRSLPNTFEEARPILDQSLQESAAVTSRVEAGAKAPYPPRGLQAYSGTLEVTLTWMPPQKAQDVAGYAIFKDSENNRIMDIDNAHILRATIKVPSDTAAAFYVACKNESGTLSRREQVIGRANTDQVVISGTGGGTAGESATPADDWTQQYNEAFAARWGSE